MQMSDVIADMLTRIRNANNAKHETVDIPASNMKKAIAEILLNAGNLTLVCKLSEADTANSVFSQICVGTAANFTSVIFTSREFLCSLLL